jgi:hypothetical protein
MHITKSGILGEVRSIYYKPNKGILAVQDKFGTIWSVD